ncbi:hypothetical protein PG991_006073 [Apiospora marii]|uniref:BZIP domain-containing protein n=1 Tax=Apiospora marii TaxID=335849 RepID=A0ABR1SAZ5_9PEZI
MSPSAAATAAAKPPKRKPPVRRDPERRRQQNMEAQKRYRKRRSLENASGRTTLLLTDALGEKLRQRIGDLEAIAASVSPSQVLVAEAGDAPSLRMSERRRTTTTETDATVAKNGPSSCRNSSPIAAEDGRSGRGDSGVSAPVSPAAARGAVVRKEKDSPWMIVSQTNETPLSPDSWDSVVYLDPSLLVGHSPDSDNSLAWMPASGCGCSSPDDGLQRIVSHRGGSQKPFGSNAGLSDPYANHLRLETVCTLDAMFSLGTLLGIPSERMCPLETQSPFFRPGIDESSSTDAIRTVQKIFRTLKPDLRPGREQVTVAHHPFIDCLPFPTLRRNLLVHGRISTRSSSSST